MGCPPFPAQYGSKWSLLSKEFNLQKSKPVFGSELVSTGCQIGLVSIGLVLVLNVPKWGRWEIHEFGISFILAKSNLALGDLASGKELFFTRVHFLVAGTDD